VIVNWMQRRMDGPKRNQEVGENYMMKSFIIFYSSPNIIWVIKSRSIG
jgi:hypothetical protein